MLSGVAVLKKLRAETAFVEIVETMRQLMADHFLRLGVFEDDTNVFESVEIFYFEFEK